MSRNTGDSSDPEAHLLIRWAGAVLRGQREISAQHEPDWRHLADLAEWNGMAPLIYRLLSTSPNLPVPTATLQRLRSFYHENALRNVVLAWELNRILLILAEHNVVAIPFKGPTLACMAYGDLMLRQFHDLDILVPKQDVMKSLELLIGQGYRAEGGSGRVAAMLRSNLHNEVSLTSHGSMFEVELHWRVAPAGMYFPFDGKPSQLVSVDVDGLLLRTFCPEDLLLLLCVHGAKHRWQRLYMVADVAGIMLRHANSIRWEHLLSMASSLTSRRRLLAGVALARDIFHVDIPPNVELATNADSTVNSLTRTVKRNFCNGPPGNRQAVLADFWFDVRAADRLSDRAAVTLRFCRNRLSPNEADYAIALLPHPLRFLYYPLRFLRLAQSLRMRILIR